MLVSLWLGDTLADNFINIIWRFGVRTTFLKELTNPSSTLVVNLRVFRIYIYFWLVLFLWIWLVLYPYSRMFYVYGNGPEPLTDFSTYSHELDLNSKSPLWWGLIMPSQYCDHYTVTEAPGPSVDWRGQFVIVSVRQSVNVVQIMTPMATLIAFLIPALHVHQHYLWIVYTLRLTMWKWRLALSLLSCR